MKKLILPLMILSVLFGTLSFAQEAELPDPGFTPSSPFYFLDTLGEKIGMFFTFGVEKKAEKAFRYAEEKLAEVKGMAVANKIEALKKAGQKYQEYLALFFEKGGKASEEGKDVKELERVSKSKSLDYLRVLSDTREEAPEEAKAEVEKIIDVSRKFFGETIWSIHEEKMQGLKEKLKEALEVEEVPKIEEKPYIKAISPNVGEEWVVGQTYKIEWQSSGLEKITIDLLAYNSEGQVIKGFQHFIAKSIDATRDYYNWTVPEIADFPNYKLRIYNKLCTGGDELLAECKKTQYFDESDNYFSIVSSIVWEALSACEKIRETSDIDLRQRCIAMVKKYPSGCEILSDPETYCYKDVALVTRDSVICEKIKDSGRRGACEALAERVPAKCSGWIYADYCYEEVAALTGDASICNLINYSGGRTDCKAVVLKDVLYCKNSDSEDCYQALALLTGDEKVCEGLKERENLERARDLDREVNKCIKMARREIIGCSEVSGTGIDCDMIPVVAKKPSWCENLEVNRDRCYFYTAMRIADLLPLELILLRN